MEKQDGKTAAAKWYIPAHHDLFAPVHLTVLDDDLYSHQLWRYILTILEFIIAGRMI